MAVVSKGKNEHTYIHIHTYTNTYMHSHKPVHVADACLTNNGGCDSKRKCKNTAGSISCGDCPAGYANDGAKSCKGL